MPRPRKSQITVTSRADAAKTRNVALARRLASGNPFGGGTRAIPLKEPGRWHTYIANTLANPNELYEMKERGWVPLEIADLACPIEESGFRLSEDGHIVRGGQAQMEMVFKMEKADYDMLVAAKTAANMRGIGSAKQVKVDMAEAASAQLGDEAATFINNLDGQVIDHITGGEAQ